MKELEYIGYAAGFVTTLALLPQAIKVIRSKQTRDISLLWIAFMIIGIFLWLCYGYANESLPMTIANAVTLLLLTVILIFKLRFK